MCYCYCDECWENGKPGFNFLRLFFFLFLVIFFLVLLPIWAFAGSSSVVYGVQSSPAVSDSTSGYLTSSEGFTITTTPNQVITVQASAVIPSDKDMWTIIVGFLLPLLIAWANRIPVPNYLVAFFLCVGAALGDVWFGGQWETSNIMRSLLIVFFTTVTSYRAVWRPSGLTDKIEGKS